MRSIKTSFLFTFSSRACYAHAPRQCLFFWKSHGKCRGTAAPQNAHTNNFVQGCLMCGDGQICRLQHTQVIRSFLFDAFFPTSKLFACCQWLQRKSCTDLCTAVEKMLWCCCFSRLSLHRNSDRVLLFTSAPTLHRRITASNCFILYKN